MRETGWSLSAVSVGFLREFAFSTRGPSEPIPSDSVVAVRRIAE